MPTSFRIAHCPALENPEKERVFVDQTKKLRATSGRAENLKPEIRAGRAELFWPELRAGRAGKNVARLGPWYLLT